MNFIDVLWILLSIGGTIIPVHSGSDDEALDSNRIDNTKYNKIYPHCSGSYYSYSLDIDGSHLECSCSSGPYSSSCVGNFKVSNDKDQIFLDQLMMEGRIICCKEQLPTPFDPNAEKTTTEPEKGSKDDKSPSEQTKGDDDESKQLKSTTKAPEEVTERVTDPKSTDIITTTTEVTPEPPVIDITTTPVPIPAATTGPPATVNPKPKPAEGFTAPILLGTIHAKTYYLDKSTTRTWNDADTYCRKIGLRLATIQTRWERKFLFELETPELGQSEYGGTFFWLDGVEGDEDKDHFKWNHIQTGLFSELRWDTEDENTLCVLYHAAKGANNGILYSELCSQKYFTMCQVQPKPIIAKEGTVTVKYLRKPRELGKYNGKTYYSYSYTEKTWKEAKSYCEYFGYKLAEIQTHAEHQFLQGLQDPRHFGSYFYLNGVSYYGEDYWTAGRGIVKQPKNRFVWDTSDIKFRATGLAYHDHNDPSTCVTYHAVNGSNNGHLQLVNCGQRRFTLCEAAPKALSGGQPPFALRRPKYVGAVDNKHYYYYGYSAMTWNEAKLFCRKLNLQMAEMKSPAQQELIKKFPTKNNTVLGQMWVNGFAKNENPTFLTNNHQTLFNGLPFLPYEKNDHPYCYCLMIHSSTGASNGLLDADPCVDLKHVLCQSFGDEIDFYNGRFWTHFW